MSEIACARDLIDLVRADQDAPISGLSRAIVSHVSELKSMVEAEKIEQVDAAIKSK
jgi:hypothetical protein